MLIAARAELERGTAWFLRGRRLSGEMGATIARFRPPIEALGARWPELLDAASRERLEAAAAQWRAQGVPAALAARVASLDGLSSTLDIVEVAESARRPVELVAEARFALATRLELPWLRGRIAQLPADRHWQSLARAAMLEDLAEVERTIVTEALTADPRTAACKALLDAWEARSRRAIERAQQLMGELRAAPVADREMLAVALRELRNLA
jgi:glutamate dehydrogenase